MRAHKIITLSSQLFLASLVFIGCSKGPEVLVVKATRGAIEEVITKANSGTTRVEQLAELTFGTVGRVKELNVRRGEIVIASKQDALVLQSEAILGVGSARYVYKLAGSRIYRTPVTVGITALTTSEIVLGLSDGDEVVLPSYKIALKDGSTVQPNPLQPQR